MPIAHVNGTALHYHVKGTGLPVVFIHPPLINSAIFRYQQVQLSDEYKVITFDVRGHGFSAHSEIPVTYPLIVEDIAALLDELEIPQAVLCGYSAGGSIVLEALLEAPHRFVGGIVASGMSEVNDLWLKSKIKLGELMSAPLAIRLLNLGISFGNADMGLTFRNLHNEARHGNIDNIRQYMGCSLRYNCTDRLHYIRQPMLLMAGEHDMRFRIYAKTILNQVPHADTAVVKDAGHYLFTKNYAETHAHLRRWLDRFDLPTRKRNYVKEDSVIQGEAAGESAFTDT
jgi:pimeloyl-ACP methyl ester carboxylesterase